MGVRRGQEEKGGGQSIRNLTHARRCGAALDSEGGGTRNSSEFCHKEARNDNTPTTLKKNTPTTLLHLFIDA